MTHLVLLPSFGSRVFLGFDVEKRFSWKNCDAEQQVEYSTDANVFKCQDLMHEN